MKIIKSDQKEMMESYLSFENYEAWQKALKKAPEKGVKTHPFISNWKYLPVEVIKGKLEYFFAGLYKIEVVDSKQVANSVLVTVRIHYFHPFFKAWLFHDGCGAAAMQVNKGANAMDSNEIKAAAVEMAFPKAKSEAIKNAAKEFGPAFGSNLNSKNFSDYDFSINEMVRAEYCPIDQIMNEQ